MGNLGCFLKESQLRQSRATQPCLSITHHVYTVLCDHTTGCCEAYCFMTYGYGIFNVRTHLGVCRMAVRSKQVCTRIDQEGQKNVTYLPRQGFEPRVFGFDIRLTELLGLGLGLIR